MPIKQSKRKGPRKPPKERNLEKVWEETPALFGHHKTKREINRNRGRGFLSKYPDVSQRLDIISLLQKSGIFIPRVKSVDRKHNLIIFEKQGKSLNRIIGPFISAGLTTKRKSILSLHFSKFARALGKVHSLSVSHGHPHTGNVIVKGNRVGFIDFDRTVRRPELDWSNPEKIHEFFVIDYDHISDNLSDLERGSNSNIKFFQQLHRKFFQKLIENYPCTPKVKKEILDLILRRLFREGDFDMGK